MGRLTAVLVVLLVGCAHVRNGVGTGMWAPVGDTDFADESGRAPTLVIEGQQGLRINEYASIDLYSHITMSDWELAGDAYAWLNDHVDTEHILFTWPLFMMGYATAWMLATDVAASGVNLTIHPTPTASNGLYFQVGLAPTLLLESDGALGVSLVNGVGFKVSELVAIEGRTLLMNPTEPRAVAGSFNVVFSLERKRPAQPPPLQPPPAPYQPYQPYQQPVQPAPQPYVPPTQPAPPPPNQPQPSPYTPAPPPPPPPPPR